METKNQVRNVPVQPRFDIPTAPYMQATSRIPQIHPATRIEPTYHITRHQSKELIQLQSSVPTVRKAEPCRFTVNPSGFASANCCPRRPSFQESYTPKPVMFGSAISDPNLKWSMPIHEKALRDMHKEAMSSAGIMAVDRSKLPQHWPINVPPRLQNPEVVQHQSAGSYNRNLPSELNHLQMQGRPESHPYSNRFATPGTEQSNSFNRSLYRGGGSAFSRPPAHAVSPAAYSSLDMEIRRLQGMITRVEMLREKYKHQEDTLQYPRSLPNTYTPGVHGRSFSTQPNGFTAWCAQQQRQQATASNIESRPNHTNSYPFQQEVPQLYSPKHGLNRDITNQLANQQARCPIIMPNGQSLEAYLAKNQNDGMPRIVDVRSLAQGACKAVHAEKPHISGSETAKQKVATNPKHNVRLSTESRNETGSVESLDSGVECMSSPTDVPCQRSLPCGYGKPKPTEDMYIKDELFIRQEPYKSHGQAPFTPIPPCISPGSLKLDRRVCPALSTPPPLTKTKSNRKRSLSNAVVETQVKKEKAGTHFLGATTKIPERISKADSTRENESALDLSLKKRHACEIDGRKEPKKILQMQTKRPESQLMNLSTRADSVIAVTERSSPGTVPSDWCSSGKCPPGILHHHGKAASTDDLVSLSVKLANEFPRLNESKDLIQDICRDQQLGTRGRFITKLIRRAEDILQERPISTPGNNDQPVKIHSSDAPDEQSTQTSDVTECGLNLKVSNNKNSCYIDVMVSEALRVFRSPPSEEEIEKQNMSFDSNSPHEKMDGALCHSPGELVISQEETEKHTCNIPAAASLFNEPKRSDGDGRSPIIVNSKNEQTSQSSEKPQSTQNSLAAPQASRSPAKMKLPDVRVRPLKPIAPKPVVQVGIPIGMKILPWIQGVKVVEIPATKRQEHPSKKDDTQDSSTDFSHSAPNFLIPTEDGFRRMQKVDAKTQEIYRVTVHPLDGPQLPNHHKQPQKAFYGVYYREMTFPCVLRSEVPFVPTQLLVHDLFPGIHAARVFKALQQCNILNRYMIRHEQEALQEQLRRRGITSCKLIPLDEFHNKWDEIMHLLPRTEAGN